MKKSFILVCTLISIAPQLLASEHEEFIIVANDMTYDDYPPLPSNPQLIERQISVCDWTSKFQELENLQGQRQGSKKPALPSLIYKAKRKQSKVKTIQPTIDDEVIFSCKESSCHRSKKNAQSNGKMRKHAVTLYQFLQARKSKPCDRDQLETEHIKKLNQIVKHVGRCNAYTLKSRAYTQIKELIS